MITAVALDEKKLRSSRTALCLRFTPTVQAAMTGSNPWFVGWKSLSASSGIARAPHETPPGRKITVVCANPQTVTQLALTPRTLKSNYLLCLTCLTCLVMPDACYDRGAPTIVVFFCKISSNFRSLRPLLTQKSIWTKRKLLPDQQIPWPSQVFNENRAKKKQQSEYFVLRKPRCSETVSAKNRYILTPLSSLQSSLQ